MRKFLFSPSVWSSVFAAIGVIRTTKSGPRDWRLLLQWLVWGATVALAVDSVNQRSKNAKDY